jgi:hypothetical protein
MNSNQMNVYENFFLCYHHNRCILTKDPRIENRTNFPRIQIKRMFVKTSFFDTITQRVY